MPGSHNHFCLSFGVFIIAITFNLPSYLGHEVTLRCSSQTNTCLPVYHSMKTSRCPFLITERQAVKL